MSDKSIPHRRFELPFSTSVLRENVELLSFSIDTHTFPLENSTSLQSLAKVVLYHTRENPIIASDKTNFFMINSIWIKFMGYICIIILLIY